MPISSLDITTTDVPIAGTQKAPNILNHRILKLFFRAATVPREREATTKTPFRGTEHGKQEGFLGVEK